MLDMILIFLNLLGLVLCPNMWSILENIPCVLEKIVYSAALGWNAQRAQLNPSDLVYYLRPPFHCWFSLWKRYVDVKGVLKSLTLTVLWSIPLFMFIKICFIYLCTGHWVYWFWASWEGLWSRPIEDAACDCPYATCLELSAIHSFQLPLLCLGVWKRDHAVYQDQLLPAPDPGTGQQKSQGSQRSSASTCLCLKASC